MTCKEDGTAAAAAKGCQVSWQSVSTESNYANGFHSMVPVVVVHLLLAIHVLREHRFLRFPRLIRYSHGM